MHGSGACVLCATTTRYPFKVVEGEWVAEQSLEKGDVKPDRQLDLVDDRLGEHHPEELKELNNAQNTQRTDRA